jgi:hypothetical protein
VFLEEDEIEVDELAAATDGAEQGLPLGRESERRSRAFTSVARRGQRDECHERSDQGREFRSRHNAWSLPMQSVHAWPPAHLSGRNSPALIS